MKKLIFNLLRSSYPAVSLFFALFILLSVGGHAQIIDNRLGNAFSEEMYFNQEFLWQNKIKSISGQLSVKRPNRPIQKLPDIFVFRFNEVGLLKAMDKVSSVLHLVDSLRVEFKRNDLGEVEIRKETNPRGILTTAMLYDDQGRVNRIDFSKAENRSLEPGTLDRGTPILVNSESYEYFSGGDHISRRRALNNYGLFYSEKTTMRDSMGYIVTETEELVMSGRSVTRSYTYNDHGWIDEIMVKDNQSNPSKSDQFYYDTLGNLHKVEYYQENELIREIEVLYTETMLLEALIDHDLQNHDILITKFSYEFYP